MTPSAGATRRILFVSAARDIYGAENSLLHVVRRLDPTAWEPRFVVPQGGAFERMLREEGWPVTPLSVPSGFDNGILRGIPAVLRLTRVIQNSRADLVHLNLHFAWPTVAAACWLSGVPVVVHVRNMMGPGRPGRLDRWLFGRVTRLICISQAVRQSVFESKLPSEHTAERIRVIPDARDLSSLRKGDRNRFRAELGIQPDAPLIGMIARLEPMKGQDLFLRAAHGVAERLPQARFVIIGDVMQETQREYRRDLERLALEPPLAGRVTFLGYRSDIPDVLAGLDCFVHSSRRGAFVSVLIEAMAAGVPIVASRVDGIPECVGDTGVAELVAPLEPAAFTEAILRVMTNPARARAMSAQGKDRVASLFDVEPRARQTEAVFLETLH